MKKSKIIQTDVTVTKFIPGGQALGTLSDGKKVMLWGTLPGETIKVIETTKNKSSYVEGVALQVENYSPKRITPLDDCYLSTSPWQIMDYESELTEKHELLREVFRQHGIEYTDLPAVQTDNQDFYYRNKMEYALYYDIEKAQIFPAFRRRGSHRKIPLAQSSIERPEIWQHAQQIIQDLNDRHEEARKYQSLLLRCNQAGEVSGGLFENHQPHPVFDNLTDTILGQTYSYSPNGFFQINLPVYEMALTEIKKWITTDQVLDLYAGVGTIGLSVARDRKLTLIECDESAYREMEHNCQGTNAQPVLAKSEEALEYITPDQTVIFDPPRAGCQPALLRRVLEVKPRRLIYLSCNPATQARDVKILLEDYRIIHVQPFNFFPRTPHLENLIILDQK